MAFTIHVLYILYIPRKFLFPRFSEVANVIIINA